MKKKEISVFGMTALLVLGLVLGGCPADTGGGCKGDGGCYYFRSNDDYKWCGDKNCAIWESPDAGQTSLHCDCD